MALQKISHTQVSNEFIDNWMAKLNPSAVKVFLAIARKTIGWHKETDAISLSQMQEMTGISRPGLLKALKELEEHGLISGERRGRKSTQWTINYTEVGNSVNQCSKLSLPEVVNSVNPQKKGKKLSKETPQSSPSAQPLVARFIELHEEVAGEKPADIAKAGGIFKKLLKTHSSATILSKLENYYRGKYWFTEDGTHSIMGFRGHFDEIKSVSPRSSDKGNSKPLSREELNQKWAESMSHSNLKGVLSVL